MSVVTRPDAFSRVISLIWPKPLELPVVLAGQKAMRGERHGGGLWNGMGQEKEGTVEDGLKCKKISLCLVSSITYSFIRIRFRNCYASRTDTEKIELDPV